MGQAVHTSPSAGALILSSLHVLNTDPDTATIDKVDIPQRHESLYFEDDTVVFLVWSDSHSIGRRSIP